MSEWKRRSQEVSNLLNPAFCGLVLHHAIFNYQQRLSRGMPVSLMYLILPLVLHRATREKLPSSVSTSILAWALENPGIRMGFCERAKSMIQFTNEGVLMLQSNDYLEQTERRDVFSVSRKFSQAGIRAYENLDTEVKQILRCAGLLGRIFDKAGSPASVYLALGVTP